MDSFYISIYIFGTANEINLMNTNRLASIQQQQNIRVGTVCMILRISVPGRHNVFNATFANLTELLNTSTLYELHMRQVL